MASYESESSMSASSSGSSSQNEKKYSSKRNHGKSSKVVSSQKSKQFIYEDGKDYSNSGNSSISGMISSNCGKDGGIPPRQNGRRKRSRHPPSGANDEDESDFELENRYRYEDEHRASNDLVPHGVPESIEISISNSDHSHDSVTAPVQPRALNYFSMTNRPDADSSYTGGSRSIPDSEGLSMDDDDYDGRDDEEEVVIDKIIARRTDTLKIWVKRCEKMNTSEIECGSLWRDKFSRRKMEVQVNGDVKEERFLVKWADCAYIHCSWEVKEVLLEHTVNGKMQLENFHRIHGESGYRYDANDRAGGEFFDPLFVNIDRILDIQRGGADDDDTLPVPVILDKSHPDYEAGTGCQFLIKWKNMPYSDSTYEHERDLIMMQVEFLTHRDAFWKRDEKPGSKAIKRDLAKHNRSFHRLRRLFRSANNDNRQNVDIDLYAKELEAQLFRNGGQLRNFQAEGVAWLMGNYVNRRSSILADEMGLGKTIQTAAFLQTLANTFGNRGPFLIIAPLSTVYQWHRELSNWTDLNVIIYSGNALDRAMIREFEFAFRCDRPVKLKNRQKYLKHCGGSTTNKVWMVQVVITSPEIMLAKDHDELFSLDWEMLIVDEAHNRLKSNSSKFSKFVRDERFLFRQCLLLTGTPVQNRIDELWTLLNIVDPIVFGDNSYFIERYGSMQGKQRIDELRNIIRPYILRRLKEDVEKDLPSKEETIIEVELTAFQKRFYRAIYEKNFKFLRNNKKGHAHHITNMIMELRKCCNHPFLLEGVEEKAEKEIERKNTNDEADFLIKSSGKLVLLDKLLPKLKDGGHKVLIFSQFKIMLNIIQDYLLLRNFKHERIDGSVKGKTRQMAIDRFQENVGSSFIMLLTTRAGGVGINLTAADTCIIFDSDWNPQNDLQAQARCHRIGQTKNVKVYRFLTRKTYEMRMFHLGSLKMGLDKAILQGIESKKEKILTEEEAERLLRYGIYDVLAKDTNKCNGGEPESQRFVEEDIETILLRRSTTTQHTNPSKNRFNFNKTSFKASKEDLFHSDGVPDRDVDVDDPDFWKKISSIMTTPESAPQALKNINKNNAELDYNDGGQDSDGIGDDSDYKCNDYAKPVARKKRRTRSMSKENVEKANCNDLTFEQIRPEELLEGDDSLNTRTGNTTQIDEATPKDESTLKEGGSPKYNYVDPDKAVDLSLMSISKVELKANDHFSNHATRPSSSVTGAEIPKMVSLPPINLAMDEIMVGEATPDKTTRPKRSQEKPTKNSFENIEPTTKKFSAERNRGPPRSHMRSESTNIAPHSTPITISKSKQRAREVLSKESSTRTHKNKILTKVTARRRGRPPRKSSKEDNKLLEENAMTNNNPIEPPEPTSATRRRGRHPRKSSKEDNKVLEKDVTKSNNPVERARENAATSKPNRRSRDISRSSWAFLGSSNGSNERTKEVKSNRAPGRRRNRKRKSETRSILETMFSAR